MVLTGVSLAIWRSNGVLKTKRIGTWVLNLGVGAAIFALLAPISANARGGWLIATATLLLLGCFLKVGSDKSMLPDDVPTIWFSFGCLAVLVLSLWTVPYGHYAFTDGELIAESGRTVAMSTKLPFTVMLLLLIGAFMLAEVARG